MARPKIRLAWRTILATRISHEPHVREFVTGARVAHLATADASGAPHNVPLCYWFDGERIYFAIDEKPKRQTGWRSSGCAISPRIHASLL